MTLHEVPILSGLGLTMTGARPGGFGDLNGKTNEICAPGDLICAAPEEAFSVANLPATLNTLPAAPANRSTRCTPPPSAGAWTGCRPPTGR